MTVTRGDIVRVPLMPSDLWLAYIYARKAMVGGASNVRAEDREDKLLMDQFIGVGLGELCGNKHYFTIEDYIASRRARNENPTAGDSGSDTPGYRIDYKASAMNGSDDPLKYRLAVRPRERHGGNCYVLALVRTFGQTVEQMIFNQEPEVGIVGWAHDGDLPELPSNKGVFKGAFIIGAKQLSPPASLNVEDFRIG